MLCVENLSKIYPRHVKAVEGVSFEIPADEIVGLLGANGAGKTTIIKMIATLIRPRLGEVNSCGLSRFQRSTNRHLSLYS